MNKLKIIYALFIAVVFLLLVNIGIEFTHHKKNPARAASISKDEVISVFKEVLGGFSLDKSWIQVSEKQALTSFTVKLPADLPVTFILNELNEFLSGKNVILKSKEFRIGGDNALIISSGGADMLQARFVYDKNIMRKEITFGFLLTGVQDLSEKKLSELLDLHENFEVVIVPSVEADVLPEKVLQNNKEYSVLLNDDVKDVKYKLNASYEIKRLSSTVSLVVSSYPRAKAFYIDDKSDLFKSAVSNFLKEEFAKRSMRLRTLGSLPFIKSRNREDFYSLMKYYCESTEANGRKVLAIEAGDYLSFHDALKDFRKKGIKFLLPSAI